MLHERKKAEAHDDFWRETVKILPQLNSSKNAFLVTDGEKAIIDAATKYLPNLKKFRCLNHILQNGKR
jgi:hypothetical protein